MKTQTSTWLRRGAVAAAVLAASIVVLIRVGQRVNQVWDDAYRAELFDKSLVGYFDAHDGAWPRNWQQLGAFIEEQTEMNPDYYTAAHLQQQFHVDFQFEPAEVDWSLPWEAQQGRFRVVQARPGRGSVLAGTDVNLRVYLSLQERLRPQQ